MAHLKIKKFLISVEFLSKFFLLSPHGTCANPTYKDLRFSNVFVLFGFIAYSCFHLNYVVNNDDAAERTKIVTFFIDFYNKYSGIFLVSILIIIQYFHQALTAKINKTFEEIDEIFKVELNLNVENVKTMR